RRVRIARTLCALAVTAAAILFATTGSGADTIVFGPQTYSGTGRPVLSIKTFNVTAGGSGYTLRVTNHGVFAALGVLNGRLILWPGDFLDPPGPPCGENDPWQPEWDRVQREWRSDKTVRTRSLIEKSVSLRTGRNEIIVAFIARSSSSFTIDIRKTN